MSSPQDDWRAAGGENAKRLEHAIDGMRSDLASHRFPDFWRHVKDVSALFKELKPLAREDRERLWSAFGSLCEQAKSQQGQTQQRRENTSRQKRELVESKLSEAYYQAKGSKSSADVKIADQLLAEALSWMKPGWSQVSVGDDLFHLSDGRMTNSDHDACWERWKEIKETIKWKRQEFHEEWQRKQDAWRASMQEARSRTIDRIDKARSVIRRLEDQIDHCHDLKGGAKSWDFESKVQGWIDEKRDKIRDIEESIRRDEDRITDIDRKLRE